MELFIKECSYFDPMLLVSRLPAGSNFVFFDSAKQTSQGMFSFLCYDPFSLITCQNGICYVDGVATKEHPTKILSEKLREFENFETQEVPFYGGLAGFIGYEFANYVEPKIKLLKQSEKKFPDLVMGVFDLVMAFDHERQKCWIYSSGLPEIQAEGRKKRAIARCEQLLGNLSRNSSIVMSERKYLSLSAIKPNITYQEYCQRINKTLDYINAGDIYQANIAQRFHCTLPNELSSLELYARLRQKNAAPFAAFLQLQNNTIASASPERFIASRNRFITTSPIKGTTKRDANAEYDHMLAHMLQSCDKNRAENLMIVDLMRNDLSKVCELFSVNVPKLFSIESFATVHHLVSTINGQLRSDLDVIDLIAAAFPGGSITGTPKIRAMEIIDEIEKDQRGPYCGSVAYFGPHGNMDSSILIRTLVIKDKHLTFHVGGGIVADSKPHDEYLETLIKASALFATLTNKPINLDFNSFSPHALA